jgi:hypothetical protein
MKASCVVRAMTDADFPQLLALYEQVSGCPKGTTSEQLASHLHRVFIDNPWRDDALPSLVVEQADGALCGCLGVVPRPMMFAGKEILTASSHSFLMAPESRAGLSVCFYQERRSSLCVRVKVQAPAYGSFLAAR